MAMHGAVTAVLTWAVLNGAAALADTAGEVAFDRTMKSEILGKEVEYTIYLPPNYSDQRAYPVLYLMHGGGDGDNSDWYLYGAADRTFDRLIRDGEVPPFIAVTPDGRRDDTLEFNTYYMNDADGGYRWEDMFTQEFIPFIEATYPAIPAERGRAIMGLSMGGYAALAYALKYPDMFAAAAGLSPAIRTDAQIVAMGQKGYDRRYGKAWGPGLEGEARLNDAYRANSVFHLLETLPPATVTATELFIDTGADDVFFEGSVLMHNMLRAPRAGDERSFDSSHRFMIREGAHNFAYWRSGLPEAVRFAMGVIER